MVREVVPPEAVPFLFPPGDAAALGAHVVRLLEDDTLRRALGAACSRHIAEHFRPEAMCDAMADLIEQEISRP